MSHSEKGNQVEKFNWIAKWVLISFVAFLVANAMVGCNTMAGIGKDIQAAAVGVQSEMADDPVPRYARD